MKKILLFTCIVFFSIQAQAQNSTLWNKIQEIRQQYFPETINQNTHSVNKQFIKNINDYTYTFKSPMIIIDNEIVSYAVVTSEQDAKAKINTYQLSQIAGINYILSNDPTRVIYGANANAGVILIYTHPFTATNTWVRDTFKISYENGQIGNKQKKGKK
ncbi:MAG: hypothetical protein OHK0045_14050 [Raineya sp.]